MIEINTKLTDRERVTQFLMSRAPFIGAGEDPIGFLMASYAYVVHQRNELKSINNKLIAALEVIAGGVTTFRIENEDGEDICTEGSTRFAHERDVVPLLEAARITLAEIKETQ